MSAYRRYVLLLLLILILGPDSVLIGQDSPYILKRQTYKVAPSSVNLSPDASMLLTGFSDGSFQLLDPLSFEPLRERKEAHFKAVQAMDMNPAMDLMLTAGHSTLRLWDKQGELVKTWTKHSTTIWNAEISRDGLWAVSSAHNKTFLLWDLKEQSLKTALRGHEDVCLAVSLSPNQQWIASGSKDQTIKIWDLATQEILFSLNGPSLPVLDLEFSPDSRLLAASSQEDDIRIYDVQSRNMLHLLKGHRDRVMEVEFSPCGNYLLSGSDDHSLILWDVKSGEQIHMFFEHASEVTDLVYASDGKSFYSVSPTGDLIHWALDPEIFVLKYFEEDYLKELAAQPVFQARRKGESKKDYQNRQSRSKTLKAEIVDRYYQLYLKEREQ